MKITPTVRACRSEKVKVGAVVGLFGAVVLHGAGALRQLEYEVSPGLAELSLNLFHVAPHQVDDLVPAVRSAQAVLRGAMTESDTDRIAAAATCAYINGVASVSPDHEALVDDIAAEAPAEYQDNPLVRAAIGRLATLLVALNGQPGAFTQLYLRSGCLPFTSPRR